MYHTCLHCTRDLGQNDVLETLPIGRRVAFDAALGRLWVICRSCGKWNLVPFDNRLETIDACERIFRDTRTRYSTDNIGLARVPEGLELVRIGAPQRPEFASWRYGMQYRKRRRVNLAIGGAGFVVPPVVGAGLELAANSIAPAGIAVVGLMLVGVYTPIIAWTMVQKQRHRIVTPIPGIAAPVVVDDARAQSFHLGFTGGEMTVTWALTLRDAFRKKTVTASGAGARLLVRRVLGLVNRNVGSEADIGHAIGRVEAGHVDRWIAELADGAVERQRPSMADAVRMLTLRPHSVSGSGSSHGVTRSPGFEAGSFALRSIARSDRLALEMWLGEEDEARALAGELALLERQWQEAEQLAAIADGLALVAEDLSPRP